MTHDKNNHISEYLGSKIFPHLGINVQEAYLGTYNGEPIVAIKDFVTGNRADLYKILYNLYRTEFQKREENQRKGIQRAKANNKYKGRKKIHVSKPKLEEVISRMERKEITAKEAAAILQLGSLSTLYRRIREFKSLLKSPPI